MAMAVLARADRGLFGNRDQLLKMSEARQHCLASLIFNSCVYSLRFNAQDFCHILNISRGLVEVEASSFESVI